MAVYMKPVSLPSPLSTHHNSLSKVPVVFQDLNGATGLVQWSDELSRFTHVASFQDPNASPCGGGSFRDGCPQNQVEGMYTVHVLGPDADPNYVYFGKPFVQYRVRRSVKAMANQSAWEAWTPLKAGARNGTEVDPGGYGWKAGLNQFGQGAERALIQQGKMSATVARLQPVDPDGNIGGCDWGASPLLGNGDVQYNTYMKKYVLIASKAMHSCARESHYGEIWLGLADEITGPWTSIKRVATHATTGTSCYNPLQLPFLQEGGGSRIYFACTITSAFSYTTNDRSKAKGYSCSWDSVGGQGCDVSIPRYEYNNMVFAVDMDELSRRRWGAAY